AEGLSGATYRKIGRHPIVPLRPSEQHSSGGENREAVRSPPGCDPAPARLAAPPGSPPTRQFSRSPHMSISLHRFALALAIALLPATAFSWGSQAGDNGRQPIGADNEGPRQAIPNAPIDYQAGTAYYSATTAHD